jgi:hypothetical protein
VLQVVKYPTKEAFKRSKGTILELLFFIFSNKSQSKYFQKNLKTFHFLFYEKTTRFKNAVSSKLRGVLLGKIKLIAVNYYFLKN